MMTHTDAKKVLIVAYYFPPIGGGGVQRALKMAKYLGEFGWQPYVLTVEPEYHVSLDPTLLEQLPEGVVIERVKEPSLGRKALRPAASASQELRSGEASSPAQAGGGLLSRWKKRLLPMLKFVKRTMLIPDEQIVWLPGAAKAGLRMMRQHGIDAVVTTSGPVTNHLVGLVLKRKLGKPWIADFRDPWTQNMHSSTIAWRQWLEERLERMVHREADCLLTVTGSFADNFRRKFGDVLHRVEVIHNGFDLEDYRDLPTHRDDRESNECVFVYTGIFYRERNPRTLLRALKKLIDEGRVEADKVKLRFAGVFDYPGYSENIDCVRELQLEGQVEILGHLPHREALTVMKQADVLLLIGDTGPGSGDYIPGKLFEYIAVGRPILALSMPGESTSIIERYRLGACADPHDQQAIETALLALYERWLHARRDEEAQHTPPSVEGVSAESLDSSDTLAIYERRHQANKLAQLLNELMANGDDNRARVDGTVGVEFGER